MSAHSLLVYDHILPLVLILHIVFLRSQLSPLRVKGPQLSLLISQALRVWPGAFPTTASPETRLGDWREMSASQGGLLCWQLGQLCAQGISLYGKMMQPLWDLGLSCVLVITIKVARAFGKMNMHERGVHGVGLCRGKSCPTLCCPRCPVGLASLIFQQP